MVSVDSKPMGRSDTFLLHNGAVVTSWVAPQVIPSGAVAWQGGRIVAVGKDAELAALHPGARRLDAHGGLVIPGLVNLHHHCYSALARGLDPGPGIHDFGQVLERLWWRLDRALADEAVEVSTLLTLADCIRSGCTTFFDHHASPSCLNGSLERIAAAVEVAGLSGVLCYEISDRNGSAEAASGLEENLAFADSHRDHPRLRGMLGLHASFTVSDETLTRAAARRPHGVGVHVHLAEDALDREASLQRYGAAPLDRFERAGLLDDRALLAHCVHLAADEYRRIAAAGAVIVHNPESNANNGVGRLDVAQARELGCRIGLGTDGMASGMLRSLRAALLSHRAGHRDPGVGFELLPGLLATNLEVARETFGEPLLGELSPGAPAELAVVECPPPTPLDAGNLYGHLVYGASEAPVRHTVGGGQVLMEDFKLTSIDLEQLAGRARGLSPAVWQRFTAL